ncbi:hypothetical protein [Streptomyces cucumeris]|uniref:hypothetical protein n=1 Tax=Streptomyces cucumeris TaxID=2962890 RepID=UPI0020C87693|nr:hypothetical protein [Streptomyces sp. NEAU-Y11]MCP9207774.1 hypothetical protein [Streptomyces sp. NEAU-Y11]
MSTADAFNDAPTMNFADIDGRPIAVRPLRDAGLGRNVVELVVHGATVRLSNAVVPQFVDGVTMAAFLGEIENVATGNHTPTGA